MAIYRQKAGWMKIAKSADDNADERFYQNYFNPDSPIAGDKNETLPMPLYDDINDINGEIMRWVEKYMDNYPKEQWAEKQSLIYKKIAEFCLSQSKNDKQ